jgi:hypothetical protein
MGAILRGIEYCQNTVYGAGIGGEQASGVALVRTVVGIARRQAPFSGGVTVQLEGANPSGRFDASILLATTLDQLFLGIRPFWGSGAGEVRGLLVEEPAHRLLRNLPALLRGRPNRHMTAATGYHSFRTDTLGVAAAGRFMLDGELYDFEDGPLVLEPSAPLRFLRLGSDPS